MATYIFPLAHTPATLISLDEVKHQCKIELEETIEDDLLAHYRDAAIKEAEDYTSRNFNQAKFRIETNGFKNMFQFPKSPVSSIDLVQYLDTDNTWQTLDSDLYELKHSDGFASVIYFEDFDELPSVKSGYGIRIRINITVGYAAAEDLPVQDKQAIFLGFTHFYEHRENTVTKFPTKAKELLKQFYYTSE